MLSYLLFFCLSCPLIYATPLSTELVTNGGAETGDTSGWSSTGIEATTNDPFSGSFAFTGAGGDASSQTLSQTIDISDLASQIDNGEITSHFSIQLQTRSNDIAEATLFFLNGSGGTIASQFFRDTDGGNFDYDLFTDTRTVASGVRRMRILLNSTRSGGVSSDGFFDDISLRLTSNSASSIPGETSSAIPEPSSYFLTLLAVLLFRKRFTS